MNDNLTQSRKNRHVLQFLSILFLSENDSRLHLARIWWLLFKTSKNFPQEKNLSREVAWLRE